MSPVCHITTPEILSRYATGIRHLLRLHRDTLLDDTTRSGSPDQDVAHLWQNTAACMPWLWIFVEPNAIVSAIGALSELQPGRHAFLHGVSDPAYRGTGCVEKTLHPLLQAAFGPLQLLKVKAELETHNTGAKGFCLRFGFRREALFRNDIAVGGRLRDVAIYSLPLEHYRQRVFSQLAKRIQDIAENSITEKSMAEKPITENASQMKPRKGNRLCR